jgi:hypothetical protein
VGTAVLLWPRLLLVVVVVVVLLLLVVVVVLLLVVVVVVVLLVVLLMLLPPPSLLPLLLPLLLLPQDLHTRHLFPPPLAVMAVCVSDYIACPHTMVRLCGCPRPARPLGRLGCPACPLPRPWS